MLREVSGGKFLTKKRRLVSCPPCPALCNMLSGLYTVDTATGLRFLCPPFNVYVSI